MSDLHKFRPICRPLSRPHKALRVIAVFLYGLLTVPALQGGQWLMAGVWIALGVAVGLSLVLAGE